MYLGVDIGGTATKMALFDGRSIASTATSDTYSRPDSQILLSALSVAFGRLERRPGSVAGVGLAAPGLYDHASDTITAAVNVPGLIGIPLRELVPRATNLPLVPVVLLTDAHAAGVDVIATEQPALTGRVAAISLGTGVGMCVLDDGVPLLLSGRSSGHLGQLDVTIHEPGREAPLGPDGGRGSLEGYIGLPALIHRLGSTPESLERDLERDRVPLFALARAVRAVHAIYRPAHIRLLGGVGIRLAPFREFLSGEISRDLTSVARAGWTLGFGTSAFHAACGAARSAAKRES
jgi:predicted NBD/HSP70 family sugar kinase